MLQPTVRSAYHRIVPESCISIPRFISSELRASTAGSIAPSARSPTVCMLYLQGKVLAGVLDEGVQRNGTGAGAKTGRNLEPRSLLGKTPQELLRLMTYWELSTQKVGAH